MLSISDYVSQSMLRLNVRPELAALIRASYESGPLAQVLAQAQAGGTSVDGASILVLYSGTDPSGVSNHVAAEAFVKATPGAYLIDETPAGIFLDKPATFESAVSKISEQLVAEGYSPVGASEAWAIKEPAWRNISADLINNSPATDIVTFVKGAGPDSVFAQVELGNALERSGFDAVNGVDPILISLSENQLAAVQSSQGDFIQKSFGFDEAKVAWVYDPVAVANNSLRSAASLEATRPMPIASLENPLAVVEEGLQNLADAAVRAGVDGASGWMQGIRVTAQGLAVVGAALVAYDLLTSSGRAIDQQRAGDTEGATRTVAELVGRLTGMVEGAATGAEMGAEFGARFGPRGILVGGLLGGLVGAISGSGIGQAFADLMLRAASGALLLINDALTSLNASQWGRAFPDGMPIADAFYAIGVAGVFGHSMTDPLVLDLSGNGIKLVPLSQSDAYFDLYNTGYAVHTGWVGPETGILVDTSHGDSVTSISDLFGSASIDGFSALRVLDENNDGVIDARDPGFSNLKVWQDSNSDGVAQLGEIKSLASFGIISIGLKTVNINRSIESNLLKEIASFTRSDGTSGEIAEAYFDNNQLDSKFQGNYQINPEVLILPNLRGYGTLPDLYIAMSLDGNLLDLVKGLVTEPVSKAENFKSRVLEIIYRWAGVDSVVPDSRGPYINAQELGVLEKFAGKNFISSFTGDESPSNWHQGEVLQQAFDQLFGEIEVRLLVQGPLAFFLPGLAFDYKSDSITGTTDLSALLSALADAAPTQFRAEEVYWCGVAPVVGALVAALGVDEGAYESLLQTVFNSHSMPFTAAEALQGSVFIGDGSTNQLIASNNGPHYFDGGSAVRHVQSDGGGDVIRFEIGYGSLEIDEFDTAVFPQNILQLGLGIKPTDVLVRIDGSERVILLVGEEKQEIILNGEASGFLAYGIQFVRFEDGTEWTRQQLITMAVTGSSGDDVIFGSPGGELFDGKGGDDLVIGKGGADTFYFNAGYGSLKIIEQHTQSVPGATLQFGGDIAPQDVTVRANGLADIVLQIGADSVTISGMAGTGPNGIDQVVFANGTVWTYADINGMARNVVGTSGNDTLNGTSGNDYIDGKGGRDFAAGGGGADTFFFGQGYGALEISDFREGAVLQLGEGLVPSQAMVSIVDGNSILLTFAAGDSVRLDRMFSSSSQGVDEIRFADGTVWGAAMVIAMVSTFTGTNGNDSLIGTSIADLFDGRGGDDTIFGAGGADTFTFNLGYGKLRIDETDYVNVPTSSLQIGQGISPDGVSLLNQGGDLILQSGTDQVTIVSMAKSATDGIGLANFADGSVWTREQLLSSLRNVQGTTGSDSLFGTYLGDYFDGHGGDDLVTGYGGGDTIFFDAGYGHLRISEAGSAGGGGNVLLLGPGISPLSVSVSTDGGSASLIIKDGVAGDQISIDEGMFSGANGVQTVKFSDGTVWTWTDLMSKIEGIGTIGNDSLTGSSQPEYFDGKGGDDTINGNGGGDTFYFNAGYGALHVYEQNWPASMNVLQLGSGIKASDVSVGQSLDGGVVIRDGVSGDLITLHNEAKYGDYYGVQKVVFADGTIWTGAQLIAMAMTPTTGADVIIPASQLTGQYFDGLGGGDYESGYGGGDTFVFNPGYGSLEISEVDYMGGTNVLRFGAGITSEMIVVSSAENGGIRLSDGIAGDVVTIDNLTMPGGAFGVQEVQFSDGTVWTAAELLSKAKPAGGTTGNDHLIGTAAPELFDGLGGDDTIEGGGGGDTVVFNPGYGKLLVNEFDFSGNVVTNVLRFGQGIAPSALQLKGGADLGVTITDGVAGDQIQLTYGLAPSMAGFQEFEFSDGSVWTLPDILRRLDTGTTGNDAMFGAYSANDKFDGLGGSDTISGNGGEDTYVFHPTYRQLNIVNGLAFIPAASGELDLDGVNTDQVWLGRVGDDLKVSIMGTDSAVTIESWYANDASKLAKIDITGAPGGDLILDSQIDQLVQTMAAFSASHPGFDPTSTANPAITDQALLAAVSAAWHQ